MRDLDLLVELARRAELTVSVSLPTLDPVLAREIEPTVASPRQRLIAVRRLAEAGVRVGLAVAPVLPELTDDAATLSAVRRAARDAGASFCWHGALRLGEVARDSYFLYLRERKPELVRRYESLYRAVNAAPPYRNALDTRYRAIAQRIPLRPAPTIACEDEAGQLSLL